VKSLEARRLGYTRGSHHQQKFPLFFTEKGKKIDNFVRMDPEDAGDLHGPAVCAELLTNRSIERAKPLSSPGQLSRRAR
jgi:hypothetical protein